MNYLKIYKQDVNAGTGLRVSIYVSGCRIHCPGCHNQETWDFDVGKEFTNDTINEIITALNSDYISGLTLLGGEPMEPENQEALRPLVVLVKKLFPKKTIWCYTGYEFKDFLKGGKRYTEDTDEILSCLDVMVVGPFKQKERNITKCNLWRGSSNQRVLTVPGSLLAGKPVPIKNIPNNSVED